MLLQIALMALLAGLWVLGSDAGGSCMKSIHRGLFISSHHVQLLVSPGCGSSPVQQQHPLQCMGRCSGILRELLMNCQGKNKSSYPSGQVDKLCCRLKGWLSKMSCLLCAVHHCLDVELYSAGSAGSTSYDREENVLSFLL